MSQAVSWQTVSDCWKLNLGVVSLLLLVSYKPFLSASSKKMGRDSKLSSERDMNTQKLICVCLWQL